MKATAIGFALLSGCVSTQATHLAGYDPSRPPTCARAVKVYASTQGVGAPFVELGYLNTSSRDPASDSMVIQSMRQKAAQLGANGLLLQGITGTTSGVGLMAVLADNKAEGKGIALWVPRDSAAVRDVCAARQAAVRDSVCKGDLVTGRRC